MTQHDNILFVPVPEDAVKFWTHCDDKTWLFFFSQSGWDGIDSVEIPEGEWRIIGTTDTMGEEEWKQVVEHLLYPMTNDISGYEDYCNPGFGHCDTATESGQTLLQSLGITNRCVVLEKL